MKKFDLKNIYPHLIVFVLIIICSSLIFFYPVLQGKDLKQMDVTHAKAAAKELTDYKEKTGEISMWTNSMFSGMPAYQIMGSKGNNIFSYLLRVFRFNLPYYTIAILFTYLLGFYILMITLKFDPWLSLIGAMAFAFTSYNIIIIEVGHITKAYALGYAPIVIAGVIQIFRSKYLLGIVLTSIATGLEIVSTHPQISYYLFLIILVMVVSYFISAYKNKSIRDFFKKVALLFLSGLLGVLPNVSSLWTTYEYGKETIRGQSELTSGSREKVSSGLDEDYAFAWSYGKIETGTLLIPNFVGGSGNEALSTNSESYKVLQSNGIPNANKIIQNMPTYWGEQPFTSGPVYVGAVVCFLFILGLFLLKGPDKWWLLGATILSIVLAWGKNFSVVNDFFFYYFPLYNKFRTVAMALVIAQITIPVFGFMALKKIVDNAAKEKTQLLSALKKALIITGGLTLLFALIPNIFFDFVSSSDEQLKTSGFPDWLIAAVRVDRKSLLSSDAWRSLVFIILSAVAIWAYITGKLQKTYLYIALAVFIVFDLVPISKRYLTSSDFFPKKEVAEVYKPNQANLEILKDKDPDFRVLNLTVSTFNDASTSYFHKSIGGYHGAKLRRYQDLYDRHIRNNNMAVINMLNTKYFIVAEKDQEPVAQYNPGALGNCWFVKGYKLVNNADEEINALDSSFNPSRVAVVDKKFEQGITEVNFKDTNTANNSIKLINYTPNHLTYQSNTTNDRLAVFSEIYYEKGWNAYVDGVLKPHFRADYVLRAMIVPKGNHTIEFKFEPKSYYIGQKIDLAGSLAIVVLSVILLVQGFKKKSSVPPVS